MASEEKALFSTSEVLSILKINSQELYTIMRPVRSNGKLLKPIFTPEQQSKLTNNWIFTQRDIIKISRYFRALREYKAAREELRKTAELPDLSWLKK